MSTATADLREDVTALLASHLQGIDATAMTEPERWKAYRSFRVALHNIVGFGAEREQQDHRNFIVAIRRFCDGIKL